VGYNPANLAGHQMAASSLLRAQGRPWDGLATRDDGER